MGTSWSLTPPHGIHCFLGLGRPPPPPQLGHPGPPPEPEDRELRPPHVCEPHHVSSDSGWDPGPVSTQGAGST